MKILVCHNYYRIRGGEDQSFEDEADLLASRGHTVYRHTIHNDSVADLGRLTLARRTISNPVSAAAVRDLIRRDRPDVLHCTNTFPLLSPSVYGAAREAGIAVVQSLRNYRLICPAATLFREGHLCEACVGNRVPWSGVRHRCYRGSRAASATVATLLMWHRWRRTWQRDVDVFYALSEFARAKLVEGGLPEAKLTVKPNFVHPDPLAGGDESTDDALPREGSRDVVFVGRLSPEKGVRWLLDAFRHVAPPARLIVVGEGPLEAWVRARSADDSRIECRGRLPISEAIDLVRGAAVSVCPSEWFEPFGRTIIESFAVGTPVVTTAHGATAELVEHERTGLLVESGDVIALAAAIQRLLDDTALRAKLGRCARATYEVNYTAAANYEMLMEIYARALAAVDLLPTPPGVSA